REQDRRQQDGAHRCSWRRCAPARFPRAMRKVYGLALPLLLCGWSTFLTGVHMDKHGVPDNRFEHPDYVHWRPVTELLREARPGAEVAVSICWKPIWEKMLAP